MAKLSDRRQNATAQVVHMKAADVEVSLASDETYLALDKALRDLQQFQQDTGTVKKAMQIAGAIATAIEPTRVDTSKRTV